MSAIAPPPPTPAAAGMPKSHHAPALMTATVQVPALVTLAAKSVVGIRLIHPVQGLNGAVEVHTSRRNAEPKPDQ
jgi:hypothetical protein